MPRNIAFTPPSDIAILDGNKVMTARYWITEYGESFKAGDRVTLSTGRKKETRFAVAEIIKITKWNGYLMNFGSDNQTGYTMIEIAKKEGFQTPAEFMEAYKALNAHNINDPYEANRRTHFFIEFKVVERLRGDA